jgi:CubicO group peptidase (beta-lactamase class C family)
LKGAAVATAALEWTAASAASAQIQGAGLPGKDYAGALGKLRAYAALHVAQYGLAGLTLVAVDRDGFFATFQLGLADVEAGKPVRPDHLFQIGSISKSFTAIAILQAIEAGKLEMDATIHSLLPTLPLPDEKITVRHLLSHISGLPDDPPLFPRGVDRLWCGFEPTTGWSYSNLGFRILGLVLEHVNGRPFYEMVQHRIFEPLGMKDARPIIATTDRDRYAVGYQSFRPDRPTPWPTPIRPAPWVDFDEASGSIASPAYDMGRYMRFLIEAGNGKGAPLLSDAMAAQFVKPVARAPEFGADAQYALGVAVIQSEGRSLIHHTGGMIAFSSSFHVDAEAGVACFASTNTNIDGYRPRDITAYACHLLRTLRHGGTTPAPRPITLGDTVEKAADYVGDYRAADGGGFAIRAAKGGLELVDDRGVAALQMKGGDLFVIRRLDYSLHMLGFVRKEGVVVAAGYGPRFFGRNGAAPPSDQPPRGLEVFAGRYDNDDPWLGAMRVIARSDGLSLDGAAPLVALPDGSWRIGADPAGCERIRFDAVVEGRVQRLNFSGVDFWRKPDV